MSRKLLTGLVLLFLSSFQLSGQVKYVKLAGMIGRAVYDSKYLTPVEVLTDYGVEDFYRLGGEFVYEKYLSKVRLSGGTYLEMTRVGADYVSSISVPIGVEKYLLGNEILPLFGVGLNTNVSLSSWSSPNRGNAIVYLSAYAKAGICRQFKSYLLQLTGFYQVNLTRTHTGYGLFDFSRRRSAMMFELALFLPLVK